MPIPQISIITVGMNHLSYMKKLLASIFDANNISIPIEMIYVDNCSTDGSVEYIKNKYPQVKILKNIKPLGFGENNNKGVFASSGKYIAIINPDIVLSKNSLDILFRYAESNSNYGILVPKLLNPNGSIQYSVRGFVSVKALFYRFLSKGNDNTNNKIVSRYLCKNLDIEKNQPVDWAIGAALFLKKDFYASLGGFDQDYFLYMEDEDLCLRSWKLHMPVIYLPQSVMTHNHLRGSSKLGKKTMFHLRSVLTFFKKHGLNIGCYCENYCLDNLEW